MKSIVTSYKALMFGLLLTQPSLSIAQTQLTCVTDVSDSVPHQTTRLMAAYNDIVYFAVASTQNAAMEFWATDGTFPGTQMLVHPWGNNVWETRGYKGKYYFYAYPTLFSTEGTTASNQVLGNFSNLKYIGELNNKLIYRVQDTTNGPYRYIETDGTSAGTQSSAFLAGMPNISPDLLVGDKAYYRMFSGPFFLTFTPWVTDGTPAGTFQLAANAIQLSGTEQLSAAYLHVLNGKVYYIDGESNLFVTDGTPAGTDMIRPKGGDIVKMAVIGNKLWFKEVVGSDCLLWMSDGTKNMMQSMGVVEKNSSLIEDEDWVECNGKLFFVADNYLWVSDGTPAGTYRISQKHDKLVPPLGSSITMPRLHAYNGRVYFHVVLSDFSMELWETDGTDNGTVRILEGTTIAVPDNKYGRDQPYIPHHYYYLSNLYFSQTPVTAAGKMYISAQTVGGGVELWRYETFPLSVSQAPLSDKAKIYPNPATDILTIDVSANAPLAARILSITGVELLRTDKVSVDISHLQPGTYFVHLSVNGRSKVEKLIKL